MNKNGELQKFYTKKLNKKDIFLHILPSIYSVRKTRLNKETSKKRINQLKKNNTINNIKMNLTTNIKNNLSFIRLMLVKT